MSERNGYEPGVPCWVTALQPDCHAGADFYSRVFGWDCEFADGFFTARLRGRPVAAVAPQSAGGGQPEWITNVYSDDPDAAAERARAAGGRGLAEPVDVTGGGAAAGPPPAGGGAVGAGRAPGPPRRQ